MNVFKKGIIAATIVVASTVTTVVNANAAESHCGVYAEWHDPVADTNKRTKIVMWWHPLDDAPEITQICLRAKDRKNSPKAIKLEVVLVGEAGPHRYVSRGRNVVETMVDINLDTSGILAMATINNRNESWIAWNWENYER